MRVRPIASSSYLVGFRLTASRRGGTPVATQALWYSLYHRRVVSDGELLAGGDSLPHTAEAYERILPELRRAGYVLVTVDDLLGAGSPGQVLPAG